MPELVVNCKQALADAHASIDAAWGRSKFFRVVIRERKRSLDQNGQAHVWYTQISEQLREDTVLGVKCECKLMVGVPLLCAEDEEFRHVWESCFAHLDHEQRLDVMKYLPVTSIMAVDTASRYLEELQKYWFRHRRVVLEFNKPKG